MSSPLIEQVLSQHVSKIAKLDDLTEKLSTVAISRGSDVDALNKYVLALNKRLSAVEQQISEINSKEINSTPKKNKLEKN